MTTEQAVREHTRASMFGGVRYETAERQRTCSWCNWPIKAGETHIAVQKDWRTNICERCVNDSVEELAKANMHLHAGEVG